jgi:phenylacetate-coenzyme A ligase PaaK-like adenylate-forming protein
MMAIPTDLRPEIKSIVSRMRSNFRWYDDLVVACGYDEDGDPARLPHMDDALLGEHYYNAQHTHLGECQSYFTSGTSRGVRKRILYSAADHALYVEERKRIFSSFVTPDCRVACADLGTGHAASSASEIFKGMGLDSFFIDFRRPVGEHVEFLNALRPDVLFTMPMILESMIHTGELRFNPKKIIVVGDVAARAWKDHVLEYFSLRRGDLMDILGSIEVGSIAHECFDCGLYHFDSHIIPETIKPSLLDDEYVPANGAEILLLTSSARTVFPAVRFVTNDLVEGFTTAHCKGRRVFVMERIIGRVGPELKNGEKVSLYDISEAVNKYLPGSRFEVYKDLQRFVIRICSHDFTTDKAEQIKLFVRHLNPDVNQMIQSSLVTDSEVCRVSVNDLSAAAAKKSFLMDNRG